jgi:protocatechuate 3,4-dioxygenase beta subunit
LIEISRTQAEHAEQGTSARRGLGRGCCRAAAAWIAVCWLSYSGYPVVAEDRTPTSETSIGIFYQADAPEVRDLWRPGDAGEQFVLRGRILDVRAMPVPGALVEMWHADASGEVHADRYRTRLRTPGDGSFAIRTAYPGHIPEAPGVWGARHIHIVVTHPDYRQLVSLILFKGDPMLAGALHDDLAIFVEQGRVEEESVRFGQVEIVLQRR